MNPLYNNIPEVIRKHKAWVGWRYINRNDGKKPTKVPFHLCTGKPASVNDPDTWCRWPDVEKHGGNFDGIGFVFSDKDPFHFIDFDATENAEHLAIQMRIYNEMPTYAERSPSGNGAHLIGLGKFEGRGRKTGDIELYCRQRFATFTGDVLRAVDPQPTEHLMTLYQQMTKHEDIPVYEPDGPERHTDERILEIAQAASNNYKFNELWNGRWAEWYPANSQNEADYALIDMLSFYTEHRGQTHRLFLQSQLGQRPKARNHKTYVHNMITGSFDRRSPPPDPAMFEAFAAAMEKSRAGEPMEQSAPALESVTVDDDTSLKPIRASDVLTAPADNVYTRPPGLLGDITDYIYSASQRPMFEIALSGAISLMAGLCGQQYNIGDSGLNYYLICVAPSSIGKEGARSGIRKILRAADKFRTPEGVSASDYLGPGAIQSGQALYNYMNETKKTCFLTIQGEYGIKLQILNDPKANSAIKGLKDLIMDLYHQSHAGGKLERSIYADTSKTTDEIHSPALTIFGESTGEEFYKACSNGLVLSGYLNRFSIIEYKGDRVPRNIKAATTPVPDKIAQSVYQLATLGKLREGNPMQVAYSDAGFALLDQWDKFCDKRYNESERDVIKATWGRAHIKAERLASLIAVGVNPQEPVIQADHARWAIDFVGRDLRLFLDIIEKGKMGHSNEMSNDEQMCDQLAVAIAAYAYSDFPKKPNAAQKPEEHSKGVVRISGIQPVFSRNNLFKDRDGKVDKNLKEAFKLLEERGWLSDYINKEDKVTAKRYIIADHSIFRAIHDRAINDQEKLDNYGKLGG